MPGAFMVTCHKLKSSGGGNFREIASIRANCRAFLFFFSLLIYLSTLYCDHSPPFLSVSSSHDTLFTLLLLLWEGKSPHGYQPAIAHVVCPYFPCEVRQDSLARWKGSIGRQKCQRQSPIQLLGDTGDQTAHVLHICRVPRSRKCIPFAWWFSLCESPWTLVSAFS